MQRICNAICVAGKTAWVPCFGENVNVGDTRRNAKCRNRCEAGLVDDERGAVRKRVVGETYHRSNGRARDGGGYTRLWRLQKGGDEAREVCGADGVAIVPVGGLPRRPAIAPLRHSREEAAWEGASRSDGGEQR